LVPFVVTSHGLDWLTGHDSWVRLGLTGARGHKIRARAPRAPAGVALAAGRRSV